MLEDRLRALHAHVNDAVLPGIKQKYGNADNGAMLAETMFSHKSDGMMGHAEKGMLVECGSELAGVHFY